MIEGFHFGDSVNASEIKSRLNWTSEMLEKLNLYLKAEKIWFRTTLRKFYT